jgi:MYXO-CTERM domain-containing protein
MFSLGFALALCSTPAAADPASTLGESESSSSEVGERKIDVGRGTGLELRWLPGPLPERPEAAIVNGRETDDFRAVVALGAQFRQGTAIFCSGTMFTRRYVLTAAHCVDALDQYVGQGATPIVLFGGNLYANDIFHFTEALSWQTSPRWNGSADNGADIALVEIESAPSGVPPIPLMTRSATSFVSGETLDYVGFGVTGDGRQDSGIKRTADIGFYQLQGDYLISYDPQKNLCSGDSGGAALRRVSGNWELAGVNSFVFDTANDGSSCFTGGSGATRVDRFLDWIEAESDWTEQGDTGGDTGEDPEPEPETDEPTTDYGDWSEPERPPEEGVAGCACHAASVNGAWAGLGVVGVLLALARRRSR